jgi:hypothetical protein
LLVASGTKGECANGTWRHGVNLLLVRLDILSIFNATMFDVVHVETSDDCAGTEGLGNSQPVREGIDPIDAEEYHFDDHSRRVVFNRCRVVGATGPLFHGANAAFNVGDMLVFATDIEL